MSDNLTEGTRKVMSAAMELAAESGHGAVYAVHLLAAASVQQPTGVLEGANVTREQALHLLDELVPQAATPPVRVLHPSAQEALTRAVATASSESRPLDVEDLVESLTDGSDPLCSNYLLNIAEQQPAQAGTKARPTVNVPAKLRDVVTDLTALAQEGKLRGAVGRDDIVERALIVLSRRGKNNPVFTGEAGVGKSAVAEQIAIHIAQGAVPSPLDEATVWSVDLGGLIAGTAARGDWEAKVKELLNAVQNASSPIILFVDELHALVGAGGGQNGGTSAADLLKPALARGQLRFMGATTTDEYRKYIEKDAALERRFTSVHVPQPDEKLALAMLEGWREELQRHHKVTITDKAMLSSVKLSSYIADRALPDRAIDVLDETCARIHLANLNSNNDLPVVVDDSHVADVVSAMTGIPVATMGVGVDFNLRDLPDRVASNVAGQREAVDAVCRAVIRGRNGFADRVRPSSLLLAGPTGVGKTHIVKTVAEQIYGPDAVTRNKLIIVDCSELDTDASISKLIGAPPGYVGFDDNVDFLERVRRNPDCMVLFDEVDKASPRVYDLMLQMLDEGHMTDAQGRQVSFANATVFLTSNHGADQAGRLSGFADQASSMKDAVLSAVKAAFRPEFINRLDDIVVFDNLTSEHAEAIAALQVAELVNIAAENNVRIQVDELALKELARHGLDPKYGARGMRRLITSSITDPVADLVLAGHSHLQVTFEDGTFQAHPVKELVNA